MRLRGSRRAWVGLAGVLTLTMLGLWWWREPDPGQIFARADAAFKAGRFAEADAALRRLSRLRPPDPIDRLLRAEVAAASQDRQGEALDELAAIPDRHPLAPLARLRAGQIEIRRGRTRPAEAAFLASIRLLPRGVQPRKELVYIYNIQHRQAELDAMLAALLDLDALDFQYVLHWTKTRNANWNPNGDLPALKKFVAADPDDRRSRLALVEALRKLERLDEAESVVSALPPSDPEARVKRIMILMDRGDLPAAESLLAERQQDHPQLARLRGQLALHRRDAAAAARHFRVALAADPLDHGALLGLGRALDLLGQPDVARPYLEAAHRHENLWHLIARAATEEGERDPKLPHELGMACAAIGRNQEARAWLRLAIRRDPLDSEGQQTLFQLEHGAAARPAGQMEVGPSTRAGFSARGRIPDSRFPDHHGYWGPASPAHSSPVAGPRSEGGSTRCSALSPPCEGGVRGGVFARSLGSGRTPGLWARNPPWPPLRKGGIGSWPFAPPHWTPISVTIGESAIWNSAGSRLVGRARVRLRA